MVILNGRFDGKHVVLDEVPEGIPPNTPVRVVVGNSDRPSSFATIAAMAIDTGLPKDFAAQHEHYIKGTPRK